MGSKRKTKGYHRGDGQEEGKEDEEEARQIDEYVRIVHKNTELFSTCDPDSLLDCLVDYAENYGKIDVAKGKYKAKLCVKSETGQVDMKVRILKVDQGKNCVEFSRCQGDQLEFFDAFGKIKEIFGDLNDTTY